jgi:hypothetical protein
MRKILLGTTAVVGAALLAPGVATAQTAPTVRIGGYFQTLYGYTRQTGTVATNVSMNNIGASDTAANGGVSPTQTNPNPVTGNIPASARLSKSDFNADAEVHVFVNGKTANGLTYGAVIEIQFDTAEAAVRNDARRAVSNKTTASIDEYYAFIASPTLGQFRMGDEDGPFGGLMNVGWVTNFGTGGIYGSWESFVARPNRTTTSPGGVGDNTKVIYLSPQFFGFDAGVSFALNEGEGEDTGCLNSFASLNCDTVYAATGNTGFARSHDLPGRRNELQAMLRWRGSIAGVGLAASFGTLQSSVVRGANATTGAVTRNLRSPTIYQGGVQASYQGFTLGATYMWGNTSFFYIPATPGAPHMEQWFVGGSYTIGAFTIGANGFWGHYPQINVANGPSQRRGGFGVGANYRLGPGLDVVAEWVQHNTKTPGVSNNFPTANLLNNNSGGNNTRDRATAQVFLTGIRLAF